LFHIGQRIIIYTFPQANSTSADALGMKLPYTRLEDPPDIRLGYLRPSNTVSARLLVTL
jgi:hypothetical protein